MRTGVTLQGVDPPGDFEEMVTEIETLGYGNLWLTDSSLHSRNCWAYLTLAARQTSRMMIGTAVTNPVTRHPAITAVAAATLDDISGGRAILGIGAGDRPLLSLGHQPARLATLEAAISAIRALWAGETVESDGPGFALHDAHYRFPPGSGIPILSTPPLGWTPGHTGQPIAAYSRAAVPSVGGRCAANRRPRRRIIVTIRPPAHSSLSATSHHGRECQSIRQFVGLPKCYRHPHPR